jgi:hypothetical protein
MKRILAILALTATALVSADAGCGMKVASIGKIKSFDEASKAVTVTVMQASDAGQVEAKEAKLTMTPDSKIIVDGKVNGAKIADLVGKSVTVVSEHGKVDFVIGLVAADA